MAGSLSHSGQPFREVEYLLPLFSNALHNDEDAQYDATQHDKVLRGGEVNFLQELDEN